VVSSVVVAGGAAAGADLSRGAAVGVVMSLSLTASSELFFTRRGGPTAPKRFVGRLVLLGLCTGNDVLCDDECIGVAATDLLTADSWVSLVRTGESAATDTSGLSMPESLVLCCRNC
jgi:hypothetical protein